MQTRKPNTFTTIHAEGALLPTDLLQRISENDASLKGLTPESYHPAPGEKLNEAINHSWNRLNGLWGAFQTVRGGLKLWRRMNLYICYERRHQFSVGQGQPTRRKVAPDVEILE